MKRILAWSLGFIALLLVLIVFYVYFMLTNDPFWIQTYRFVTGDLSPQVESQEEIIRQKAAEYGIEAYVPQLLGIMEVESGGIYEDVMQSSESLGLEPNSLDREASIDQGVRYFSELLEIAQELGVDTDAVVQAYNYGPGFLYYVADNGGRYSFELAEEFSKEVGGDETIDYFNVVSWKENGGYRYRYGNMFYSRLVNLFVNPRTDLDLDFIVNKK